MVNWWKFAFHGGPSGIEVIRLTPDVTSGNGSRPAPPAKVQSPTTPPNPSVAADVSRLKLDPRPALVMCIFPRSRRVNIVSEPIDLLELQGNTSLVSPDPSFDPMTPRLTPFLYDPFFVEAVTVGIHTAVGVPSLARIAINIIR